MTTEICDQALESGRLKGADECSGATPVSSCPWTMGGLYQRFRRDLLGHLQGLVKDPDIAEELMHDVFIRLSRMPGLGSIRQPRPFLFRVATNLAFDHLRQCQRLPESMSDAETLELESPDPGQLELLIRERRSRQLKQAIDQLPPRAKEALLLVRYREMTLREAATELGISQTMVEKHLKNALQKCRVALRPDMQ